MLELKSSQLIGCFELQTKAFKDKRGCFIKIFNTESFAAHGLENNFEEEYYTVSNKNVIRGLHFQLPPMDHVKVVYCVQGAVQDVVVDLRLGSPTYGEHAVFELSAKKGNSIYIPKGMAHGFCSLRDNSTMVYKVSTVYAPKLDAGILWNSVGASWPTTEPIVSERDQTFEPLDRFVSPFSYV
jgi:dTDP-4-dehydrorhamnose 3,5-epimerase